MFAKHALAAAIFCALLIMSGCNQAGDEPAADNVVAAGPPPAGMVRGTVLETMNSGGYTYIRLDTGQGQRWMAGPATVVETGDVVQADQGMAMTGFTSNTLERTFDVLYFVAGIQNLSRSAQPVSAAPAAMQASQPAVETVAAVEAGQDIAYVYANKDALAGKPVSLRGKVVKYNAGILGWNFIHIQDGSGDAADGTNDLIVTSKSATAVGETVVLTGTIVLDKDFGAGYSYPVLMEDASITVE